MRFLFPNSCFLGFMGSQLLICVDIVIISILINLINIIPVENYIDFFDILNYNSCRELKICLCLLYKLNLNIF